MECVNQIFIKKIGFTVPCGKCYPCLERKHNDWQVRLQYELRSSKTAYFLTFTFDDNNYPVPDTLDQAKRIITLFIKRIRHEKRFEGLRYFIVAEYGLKTHRLHYHGLMFNLNGSMVAVQSEMEQLWKNGMVHIGTVEPGSINYVTDYILKNDSSQVYRTFSKGIGKSYISDKIISYHQNNLQSQVRTPFGNYSMPRYYKKKIFTDNQLKEIYERESTRIKDEKPFTRINKENYIRQKLTRKKSLKNEKQNF